MTDTPKFDLLVATVGRRQELERFLLSLREQTYPSFAVHIADQNPPGTLDDILAEFPDLDLHRIMVEPRGVSRARNALFRFLSGDFVAFPDDDCRYLPDTLERAANAFAAAPTAGCLLADRAEDASSFSQKYRPRKEILRKSGCFRQAETYVQFYRREAVEAVGSFDEDLGPGNGLPQGGGEDTDFLLRAGEAGFRVFRDHAIRVLHPDPDFANPRPEKISAYAHGRMFLLKKHALPPHFTLGNVLWPLLVLPPELLRGKKGVLRYRFMMFRERFRAWRACRRSPG